LPEVAAERTEKATPKRRSEARRKGNVARSMEVGNVLLILAALLFFKLAGDRFFQPLLGFSRNIFQNIHLGEVNDTNVQALFLHSMLVVGKTLWPILLLLTIVALVANYAQVGFMITTDVLSPKFNKFNPVNGIKRLFSLRSGVELAKSVLKLAILGLVGYITIKQKFPEFIPLMDMSVGQIFSVVRHIIFILLLRVVIVLVILAVADYLYQRYDYEKNLKMTKQEVKDERKQAEGDPQIKSKIRQVQLQMARRRMMEAVPEAAVVITNPTHLAIALKYDEEEMDAPQVVAKGMNHLAEKIKEIARDNGVPVVENPDLARALYPHVDVGDLIPHEFYRAVAEVLAYVYSLRRVESTSA